ncbi:MAG TPA: DUF423 domain-containing protein, partial [Gammaproteobacteria bacterium]
FVGLGALAALLAVALGAYGAHGVPAAALPTWEKAVDYQATHALGLLAIGVLAGRWRCRALRVAGALLLAGTLLFSGSLYLLVLTGVRALGWVTPFGGVAFLLGWLALAWAAWRPRGER